MQPKYDFFLVLGTLFSCIGLALLLAGFLSPEKAQAETTFFYDTFDSYTSNTDLYNKGTWTNVTGGATSQINVVNAQSFTAPNSVQVLGITTLTPSSGWVTTPQNATWQTNTDTFYVSYDLRFPACTGNSSSSVERPQLGFIYDNTDLNSSGDISSNSTRGFGMTCTSNSPRVTLGADTLGTNDWFPDINKWYYIVHKIQLDHVSLGVAKWQISTYIDNVLHGTTITSNIQPQLEGIALFASNNSGSITSSFYIDNIFVTDYNPSNTGISNEYISITEPLGDTSSTTFNVGFDYFTKNSNWSHFLIQTCALSYTDQPCQSFSVEGLDYDLVQTVVEEITMSTEGYTLLTVNFWNGVSITTHCAWWNVFCTETQPQVGAGDSIRINVATTTISSDVPQWILDYETPSDLCDIVLIGGFCSALIWLFQPSDTISQKYDQLQTTLSQKQPWGIFSLVAIELKALQTQQPLEGNTLTYEGDTFFSGMTIFSWQQAKEKLTAFGFYDSRVVTIVEIFLWIMLINLIYRFFWSNQNQTV